MYPLISKWTILPGKESEALIALKALAQEVEASEPDTWMYSVHTPDFTAPNLPTPSSGEVVFFEVYKDEEAFKAHVSGPTFMGFVENYGFLFLQSNGKPYVTLEIMQRQAGFIRAELK